MILGSEGICKSITNSGSICLKVTKNALSQMNLADLNSSHLFIFSIFQISFNFLSKTYKEASVFLGKEAEKILKYHSSSSILY
jgi:hypothetical protein